jgi:hypothetical protein
LCRRSERDLVPIQLSATKARLSWTVYQRMLCIVVGSGNMWGCTVGLGEAPSPKGRKCRCGERKNCSSCCPFPTRALLLSNNHEPERLHQLGQYPRDHAPKTTTPPTLRIRRDSRWTAAASSAQRPYYYLSSHDTPVLVRRAKTLSVCISPVFSYLPIVPMMISSYYKDVRLAIPTERTTTS